MSFDETGKRYGVVRHHDAKGAWYAVRDRITSETLHGFRNRTSAHRFAANRNSMPVELHRQRVARG